MKGIVSWYNVQKGFGFIRGDDGQRVFIHKSQLPFWTIFLKKGDHVWFSVQDSLRGPVAVELTVKEN